MAIYLDVTETAVIGGASGVQRVVREIAGRSQTLGAARAADIIPVIAKDGRLHRLNARGTGVLTGPAVPGAGRGSPSHGGWAARANAALRLRAPRLFGLLQRLRFRRRVRRWAEIHADSRPVAPGTADHLVLLDSFWNGSSVLAVARAVRERGMRVTLVAYDLFPVLHPRQVDPHVANAFPKSLRRAVALADGVLAISRQVAAEMLAYFVSDLRPDQVRHFYLGHDLSSSAGDPLPGAGLPEPFLTGLGKRYVMIGTLEPRRGHAYVLDAFERMWANGGDQRLLLIGASGWRMQKFIARCRKHSRFGRHLFLLHGASDALLAAALRRADAVILASFYEGFGLPLVEALAASRPVLAADIGIFREIAGDTPLFFSPGDAGALAEAVHLFERDPEPWRRRATAFHWLDWNGAADMFFDELSTFPALQER